MQDNNGPNVEPRAFFNKLSAFFMKKTRIYDWLCTENAPTPRKPAGKAQRIGGLPGSFQGRKRQQRCHATV